jgi:PPOX class probable F420-dependent enzyme
MSYSHQAPPLSDEEIEKMLRETGFATICTHNKDGSIHAVPVSYIYYDDQIVIVSHAKTKKNRNIRRDNKVTVLIDIKQPFKGLLIYGTAEIGHDVLPMVMKVFESYVPTEKLEAVSRDYLEMVESIVLRITPDRIISFDASVQDWSKDLADKYDLDWD